MEGVIQWSLHHLNDINVMYDILLVIRRNLDNLETDHLETEHRDIPDDAGRRQTDR